MLSVAMYVMFFIVANPVRSLSKSRAEHEMALALIRLIHICLVRARAFHGKFKMDLQRHKEVMVLGAHQSYLDTNRTKPTEMIQERI